jgi:subtilisin family serine protease
MEINPHDAVNDKSRSFTASHAQQKEEPAMGERSKRLMAAVCVAALSMAVAPAGPASAGLVGGLGGLGSGLGGGVGGLTNGLGAPLGPVVTSVTGGVTGQLGVGANGPIIVGDLGVDHLGEGLDPPSLLDLRRERLRALTRANPRTLEIDHAGDPVRKGEVIVVAPTEEALARAESAGFHVLSRQSEEALGLSTVVIAAPRGKSAEAALKALRDLDPAGEYDLNHIYEPAGAGLAPSQAPSQTQVAPPRAAGLDSALIGMVDGGVAASPALAHAQIEQRGFTPGGARPTGHGTAVASLMVGDDGAFQGAAKGRGLLVADIYGAQEAAGSAETVVQALDWLTGRRVKVINMSLVGPPNALLARAVAAAQARGVLVVAAVGNDGPAAPPLYPASYPGVIAVTGVDAQDRALPEAGRAAHLDFAAPGANMAAALPGKGFGEVRGTSFAAPLVTARLSLAAAESTGAVAAVAAEAVPGKGAVGRGVVCRACRIDPRLVHARK